MLKVVAAHISESLASFIRFGSTTFITSFSSTFRIINCQTRKTIQFSKPPITVKRSSFTSFLSCSLLFMSSIHNTAV